MIKLFFGREIGIDDAIAANCAIGARNHFRQAMVGLRTKHHIDHRFALHQFGPFGLRDAAGNRDNHLVAAIGFLGFLVLAHAAQIRKYLFGGLFADMAGIEDNHIGPLGAVDRLVTQRRQNILHAQAVIDIHLTAICFYKKFLRFSHARSVSLSQNAEKRCDHSHRA